MIHCSKVSHFRKKAIFYLFFISFTVDALYLLAFRYFSVHKIFILRDEWSDRRLYRLIRQISITFFCFQYFNEWQCNEETAKNEDIFIYCWCQSMSSTWTLRNFSSNIHFFLFETFYLSYLTWFYKTIRHFHNS